WEQLLLLKRTGVALLVVEQNTRAALELGDRGYVLVSGEVRHAGPCAGLLADEELIRLYIGAQHTVAG
ncbi:MAG: branched-chain amino acid ABC transporter ATP-binding protein, partial [Actinomycetota bacterium]|nr:branched-chain amino acid ABC transporter ATP-binding protein [Actinomycetota bacterium]